MLMRKLGRTGLRVAALCLGALLGGLPGRAEAQTATAFVKPAAWSRRTSR